MCVNRLLVSFPFLVALSEGLNILAIMPHEGRSHQLVFDPLFEKLASEGHKLTVITRYPHSAPVPNWRDVIIAPEVQNSTELLTFSMLSGTRLDRYIVPAAIAMSGYSTCKEGLSHPNYQLFIKQDHHFDVMLTEIFNTPCFMGMAKKHNIPVIGLATSIWMPWMYRWFGIPSNPSWVPNHFSGFPNQMGFLTRVENIIYYVFTNLIYDIFMDYVGNRLSKEYTSIDLKETEDIMYNVAMILINTHSSINFPTANGPNVIEIGGIHVHNQPVEPLPQKFEKFLNESKHGVIYMSMGSTIKGDTFPEEKKQAFLKAFSKLPQRIIWKWEGEMENKPENVLTTRWAPQRAILCHPNTKVFISHSGLLGAMESIDCGVPMLMLPLFGDQHSNAISIEKNGGGVVLRYNDINEEVILDKLKNLLSEEFRHQAKDLSRRFNDRPMPPMDTALYWIDYVARHKGAPFMKLSSVDMPFYQYYLIDVIAFLTVITTIYVYISYLLLRFVWKICKKQKKIKKS